MKVIYDSRKDIRLTATGSASPILEKGATDSGTGRWSVLKIPTMSFYEYCRLLQLEEPILPSKLKLTKLVGMSNAELCKDEKSKVTNAFLITKQLGDLGIARHETKVPVLRIPTIAFLYLLGKAEADGQNGKL